jgi:hypothetical protein
MPVRNDDREARHGGVLGDDGAVMWDERLDETEQCEMGSASFHSFDVLARGIS